MLEQSASDRTQTSPVEAFARIGDCDNSQSKAKPNRADSSESETHPGDTVSDVAESLEGAVLLLASVEESDGVSRSARCELHALARMIAGCVDALDDLADKL